MLISNSRAGRKGSIAASTGSHSSPLSVQTATTTLTVISAGRRRVAGIPGWALTSQMAPPMSRQ